jgi:hypothetical protein
VFRQAGTAFPDFEDLNRFTAGIHKIKGKNGFRLSHIYRASLFCVLPNQCSGRKKRLRTPSAKSI